MGFTAALAFRYLNAGANEWPFPISSNFLCCLSESFIESFCAFRGLEQNHSDIPISKQLIDGPRIKINHKGPLMVDNPLIKMNVNDSRDWLVEWPEHLDGAGW